MNKGTLTFCCIILGIINLAYGNSITDQWQLVRERNGIKVYRPTEYQGSIIPIKTSMTIDYPVEAVLAVLMDTDQKNSWCPNIKSINKIKDTGPLEKIEFLQVDFPWPTDDRSFLMRSSISVSQNGKVVVYKVNSIEGARMPGDTGHVRGHIHNGSMELIRKEGRTHIISYLYTDPKGAIPDWVINIFTRKIAMDFMRGLRDEVGAGRYSSKRLTEIRKLIFKRRPATVK